MEDRRKRQLKRQEGKREGIYISYFPHNCDQTPNRAGGGGSGTSFGLQFEETQSIVARKTQEQVAPWKKEYVAGKSSLTNILAK